MNDSVSFEIPSDQVKIDANPSGEIPSDQVKLDSDEYSSAPQEILTGAEGAAKGFAGPLATAAEVGLSKLGVPGLSPEEQEARQKANPWIHGLSEAGGTLAGLATGTGELGLLSKGAKAATGALGLAKATSKAAKVGSAAIKGLIEMSGIAAGDEISKQILGRTDPEAPVASALSNVGVQGLFGAATGGILTLGGSGAGAALKKIGDTKSGRYLGQFLEDFGNRWKFNQENPNIIDSIYNELKDFHASTSDAASEVYGSEGLKSQAIEKLTSKVTTEQLSSHINDVKEVFDKIPRQIKAEPLFTTALSDWNELISQPNAKPSDIFKATDTLKRTFQELSEYNKANVSVRDAPFVKAAREVSSGLRESLEDSGVWNEAGDLQKNVNKAFSEYISPLKDFRSKFTTKVEGIHTLDPQKIKTYANNLGKTGADVTEEIRPTMMKNYIEAAEKYRSKIADLHELNGLESPISPASLDVTKQSYGGTTSGGRAADEIFKKGIGYLSNTAAGAAGFSLAKHTGLGMEGELGAFVLGKYLGDKLAPIADKTVGRISKKYVVPAALKAMEAARPGAWGEALEHAGNIEKGTRGIQAGVDSLFTGAKIAGQRLYSDSDDSTKEKIKKFISEGGLNQQIQNSIQKTSPQNQPIIPHFAEGGVVEKPLIKKDADQTSDDSRLSEVYPEQSTLMAQAKGRVYSYLNSLRPQDNQLALPFDESHKNPQQEREYDKAIHIADKPLSILHKIQTGTVEPQQIQHMKQMWPEIYSQLSAKMTKRMAEAKMNNEKMPPFHVRQAMAMFLGVPLDSAMTPAAIQAAQSVFAAQKAASQPMPVTKNKRNTSKLGSMNKQYQTADQAAASRQLSERKA